MKMFIFTDFQYNRVDFEIHAGTIKYAMAGQQFIYTLPLLFNITQIDVCVDSLKGAYVFCAYQLFAQCKS
jgi:hypothetical protein